MSSGHQDCWFKEEEVGGGEQGHDGEQGCSGEQGHKDMWVIKETLFRSENI